MEHKIKENEHGTRLDRVVKSFLQNRGSYSSHSLISKAIEEGFVLLDGKKAKPQKRVMAKQKVSFVAHFENYCQEQEKAETRLYQGLMPEILADEAGFIVINKPFGMLTHSFSGSKNQSTLEDWILSQNIGQENLERAGIVHRLDRNTSGVLIIAKEAKTKELLKGLFVERKVQKTYIALCEGNFKDLEGVINKPLIRKKGSFKRLIAKSEDEAGARNAETEYRVIARTKGYDLVFLFPKTGRTHQIRAHMKSLGHPIAGDSLYGSSKKLSNRQFLHAFKVDFSFKRRNYHFMAPLAPDLMEVLERLDIATFLRYDDEAFKEVLSC